MPFYYRIIGGVICAVFFMIIARKTWDTQRTGRADVTDRHVDKEPRYLLRSENPEAFRRHQRMNYVLLLALLGGVAMAIFKQ